MALFASPKPGLTPEQVGKAVSDAGKAVADALERAKPAATKAVEAAKPMAAKAVEAAKPLMPMAAKLAMAPGKLGKVGMFAGMAAEALGMMDTAQQQAQAQPGTPAGVPTNPAAAQPHAQPAQQPHAAVSIDQQIEAVRKLKDLLDAGALTQEEFDTKKRQIMGL